jgi:cytochrome P450
MMIYSIATHPEVERKVREEINTYMKDEDYSFENLKNLTYIDLLQKETTRYYGPAIYLF